MLLLIPFLSRWAPLLLASTVVQQAAGWTRGEVDNITLKFTA